MKMKRYVWLVTLVACVIFSTSAYSNPRQEKTKPRTSLSTLVSEDSLFYISVGDWKAVKEKYEKSPLHELLAHEGFKQFFDLIPEKVNKFLNWFSNLAQGEIGFAIGDISPFLKTLKEEVDKEDFSPEDMEKVIKKIDPIDIVFTCDLGTKAESLKKLFEGIVETKILELSEKELSQEKVSGVDTMFAKIKDTKWEARFGIADNLFIFTFSKATLEKVLKAKKDGLEKSLAKNKEFSDVSKKVSPSGDFLLYINITKLVSLVDDIGDIAGKFIPPMPPPAPPGAGETIVSAIKSLIKDLVGLDSVTSIAFGMDFSRDALSNYWYIGIKDKLKGVLAGFDVKNTKPDVPRYIPNNATSFMIMKFDVEKSWSAIDEWTGNLAGIIGMNPLAILQVMLGFNIKDDLIETLGSDITVYAVPLEIKKDEDKGQVKIPTVIILSLKDDKKLQETLETVAETHSKAVEEEEYKKIKTYKASIPGGQLDLEWAIVEKTLVIALNWENGVKNFIDKLEKKEKGIGDDENYKKLSLRLPKECIGFNYSSITSFYDSINSMKSSFAQFPIPIFKGIDFDKLPKKDLYEKLLAGSVGFIIKEDKGILSTSHIVYKK